MTAEITESHCQCGERYFIKRGECIFREDKKRIFTRPGDKTTCVFRCRRCHQPVNESVPGAEFET